MSLKYEEPLFFCVHNRENLPSKRYMCTFVTIPDTAETVLNFQASYEASRSKFDAKMKEEWCQMYRFLPSFFTEPTRIGCYTRQISEYDQFFGTYKFFLETPCERGHPSLSSP